MKDIMCLSCHKITPNVDHLYELAKNNRPMFRAKCGVCGKKKVQFITMKQYEMGKDEN